MTDIIIVDDHKLVAEGIEKLLESRKDLNVAAIACSLKEAMQLAQKIQPQIVLLDISMPDGDGIDAIPDILSVSTGTHIIMFTMYAEPSVIRRALNNNINGYLLKTAGQQELDEAINTAMAGKTYICTEAQEIINNCEEQPSLTTREQEILRLIAQGYTMKKISQELFLSFETVHGYAKSIKHKLNCNNNASLVRKAISQHLL